LEIKIFVPACKQMQYGLEGNSGIHNLWPIPFTKMEHKTGAVLEQNTWNI